MFFMWRAAWSLPAEAAYAPCRLEPGMQAWQPSFRYFDAPGYVREIYA